MKKEIKIDGMMCAHCKEHVEKALEMIDGVSARADIEKKCAIVESQSTISNETLIKAVKDAGYDPAGITDL
ncbi:MAG: heavy metal-associated domain-containing protein [Oscillospiraceae bacterium]|nr:heavy metal-associated domain-containing protein [Oscillospiraceae bacterium]